MSSRILLILGFSFATLHAADSSPEDLLRQGLFEEEANQNLDKAAEHYRAVIAAHERERALAASATFRLGEIARKKNDKETAATAFRTVTERFPEQAELARLSRENLAALGIEITAPVTPASADPEDTEIARLKEIARNSPDLIDGADADGWRPSHHAAAKGWTSVISYLLDRKVDPDGKTVTEDLAPLHLAAIHGHLGAVKILLAAKADPDLTFNIEKSNGEGFPPTTLRYGKPKGLWTALELAILHNRHETALALIEAGADIQRVGPVIPVSREALNALTLAIYLQRNEVARKLIDAGSSLDAIGKEDPITPLGFAVRRNPDMVAPLLKAGTDPKQTYSDTRVTPLQSAAGSNRIEIAKLLIDAGADVNAKDAEGLTPLHWAYSPEMVDFLVSKGANPNAKNASGLTALDYIAGSDGKSYSDVIEAHLKHGVTIEDPIALLRRCSATNLSFVRERIVYPRIKNPEAILLSVSGVHSFNPEPPPAGRVRMARVAGGSQQGRPELIALETRASSASPPPSLAEVMRMAFEPYVNPYSIRILRRGANDRIESIHEWTRVEGSALPTDWPALAWGDIVEVSNSSSGLSDAPRVNDFAALIPDRTVTFRLGGLEMPKKIPGEETFWLDGKSSETLPSLISHKIQLLADLRRFVVHRKGLPEPIKLDFSEPTDIRFRLLDGDTVEMSWDVANLYRTFNSDGVIHMISLAGKGGSGSFHVQNLIDFLSGLSFSEPIDFSKICILRRAENWKPEMVDFKAWLEGLPPSDKWDRDAIINSEPKLNPGDLVIMIQNHSEDAEKTATETLKKTNEVSAAMKPPRTPVQRQGPPSGQ